MSTLVNQPISKVRCVDFIFTAFGEGVVNHNGPSKVWNPMAESSVNNHLFPKLRGFDPLQRVLHNETGQSLGVSLNDPRIAAAKLVISSECVRSHLFKDISYGITQVTLKNAPDVLASLHGLVRGYLITEKDKGSFARKSPLFVTDFECDNPGLTFNQGTNQKAKIYAPDQSMYTYYKTGSNLIYKGKASLSIEDLQFIPLDNTYERSAMGNTNTVLQGQSLASKINEFLSNIDQPFKGRVANVKFVKNAVRRNSLSIDGESGILLDDIAICIVVDEIIRMFQSLYIRQSKGFMQVDEVIVDFNDSKKVFRSLKDVHCANPNGTEFAQYYHEVDVDEVKLAEKLANLVAKKAAQVEDTKLKNETKKNKKNAPKVSKHASPESKTVSE